MLVATSLTNYKRRRFLQGVFERALTDYQKSDEAVKQSVALMLMIFKVNIKVLYLEGSPILYAILQIHSEKDVWLVHEVARG